VPHSATIAIKIVRLNWGEGCDKIKRLFEASYGKGSHMPRTSVAIDKTKPTV